MALLALVLLGGLVLGPSCASGSGAGDTCGNGDLDPGEQCDGDNLGGLTCETLPGLSFTGGVLVCDSHCAMDTSGCTSGPGVCGDGVKDASELCDGDDLGSQSCESLGFVGGDLSCLVGCDGYDDSRCSLSETCGNGLRDGLEECDQSDLAGTTCQLLGYLGGDLDCQANCRFDESGCHDGICGNGVAEGPEECDGLDLAQQTCVTLGYSGGPLACSAGCTFDETLCGSSTCGDDVEDPGEECDGPDLAGADCVSQGFAGGALACLASCTFDTSGCTSATCGDDVADPGEECDGPDLAGADCVSQGFAGGTLACLASCTFDTSGCTSATCGDGNLDGNEQCDDGNTNGGDGCSATCTWESTCGSDATTNCGSNEYMNGVYGNDVSGYSCSSLGGNAERIYALTIPTGITSVTASLSCDDFEDDFDLMIMGGACNPTLCVASGTTGSCDSVTFGVTEGMTYYIAVEEFSAWQGVSLSISCN